MSTLGWAMEQRPETAEQKLVLVKIGEWCDMAAFLGLDALIKLAPDCIVTVERACELVADLERLGLLTVHRDFVHPFTGDRGDFLQLTGGGDEP